MTWWDDDEQYREECAAEARAQFRETAPDPGDDEYEVERFNPDTYEADVAEEYRREAFADTQEEEE